MPVKIFVGNVVSGASKHELHDLFSQYGNITECSVLNNFAFVHMSDETEASSAVNELNGYYFAGLPLTVEKARSGSNMRGKSAPHMNNGPPKRMKGGIPERVGLTKIFVGNIKDGTEDTDLRALFEAYGDVAEADICGGYGFVHMPKQIEALKAIGELKGYTLNGNQLNIELSTCNTQGRSRNNDEDQDFEEDYSGGWGDDYRGPMRGHMGGGMRYDPYKLPPPPRKMGMRRGGGMPRGRGGLFGVDFNGPRFPPLPRAGALMPPPRLPKNPPPSSGDNFARELLDLYLKNPDAFDRYAKDPNVQRSLNLSHYEVESNMAHVQEDANDSINHYYKPASDYYDLKQLNNSSVETQPVMYPNLPPPGVLNSGQSMRPQRPPLPRMRHPGSHSTDYTSFE